MSIALFKKNKTPEKKIETMGTSVDFHVEMVQKVDQILKNHPIFQEHLHTGDHTVCFSDTTSFVEQRMPLEKTITISNPQLQREHESQSNPEHVEHHQTLTPHQPTIPEEFQPEIPGSSSPFRFISTFPEELEQKDALNLNDTPRVEIINLRTFMKRDFTSTMLLNDQQNRQTTILKKQIEPKIPIEKPSDAHVEVVNIRASRKTADTIKNCFSEALQMSDSKSKIFYLNSKRHADKILQKLEKEQAYIPINLEEKALKLKEQRQQQVSEIAKTDSEQKQNDQERKKLPKESKELKKLRKLEEKKKKQEEKQRKREEKKQKKLQLKEAKKQKKMNIEQNPEIKEHKKSIEQYTENQVDVLDEDVKQVLMITDELLGKLPENVIEDFAQSKDFEIYERVMSKYKIKS
ncbi:MAG: hypothetical protein QXL17_00010 [Candidatus Thermoplasmatota archaeon]